ncbi:MAG: hypothetical protein IIB00_07430, partial [candidate division Zixibacteria bacterium]|nr:hypothetical protein [candidate division Zixibacteria bacterium]
MNFRLGAIVNPKVRVVIVLVLLLCPSIHARRLFYPQQLYDSTSSHAYKTIANDQPFFETARHDVGRLNLLVFNGGSYLWVGAIVDRDTLVSTWYDGWVGTFEFWPGTEQAQRENNELMIVRSIKDTLAPDHELAK